MFVEFDGNFLLRWNFLLFYFPLSEWVGGLWWEDRSWNWRCSKHRCRSWKSIWNNKSLRVSLINALDEDIVPVLHEPFLPCLVMCCHGTSETEWTWSCLLFQAWKLGINLSKLLLLIFSISIYGMPSKNH